MNSRLNTLVLCADMQCLIGPAHPAAAPEPPDSPSAGLLNSVWQSYSANICYLGLITLTRNVRHSETNLSG